MPYTFETLLRNRMKLQESTEGERRKEKFGEIREFYVLCFGRYLTHVHDIL
jgi:hypothetical protein